MADNIREVFSKNLKQILKNQGKTQLELAEFVGVSDASVNNWVNGIKLPRMDKVDKICQFLNVKRSELIDPQPPKEKTIEDIDFTVNIEELNLQPILHITNFLASCGNGIDFFEDEDNQEIIYLPTELVGTNTKNSWVMHTTGDSMNKIIPENSKIIVKQNEYYQNGDIVLYKVSNSFAIKEYYAYKDRVVLKPESYNQIHSQETYRYEDRDNGFEFPEILGKVIGFYGSTL